MIFVKAPLRITLGGGGSDIQSYSKQYGGFCISAAISKYSHVGINHTFKEGISLKYSDIENVETINEINHPIFREALKLINLKTPQVEIVSIADVPSNGAGLGNSGSFSVALLKALYSYKNIPILPDKIAELACDINMNKLGKIQGKQDEYICALGGITCLEFDENGDVKHYPLNVSHDTLIDLEENLMLFYTGINHNTESILSYQEEKTKDNDMEMIDNLHQVKDTGYEALNFLVDGETKKFGELLNWQWELKERRMPQVNSWLNELHYNSLKNGAIGSKIVGSGSGGFILSYVENKNEFRRYMKSIGLEELRFTFDFLGVRQIV
jgi:D-glycero-alpha-D-manno-heptose-7-phosphate kinase